MTCNNSIHDLNCSDSYNNNVLKGASATTVNQQPKQLVFNQSEVNILGKSLKACYFYITKNKNQYQNPKDILKELTTASNIISARQKNTQNQNQQSTKLKGASSLEEDINNNNNSFESLDNIRKMFGLTSNESATATATAAVSHLKRASDSTLNKNNICSKKEHLKDLLKQFNLI